jgi:hypothetical protein
LEQLKLKAFNRKDREEEEPQRTQRKATSQKLAASS